MIPLDLLPIEHPAKHEESPEYFYNNVVKHLIPDFIRIMNNGLTINEKAVDKLRDVLDNVLEDRKSVV